jgi:hypothetical protein
MTNSEKTTFVQSNIGTVYSRYAAEYLLDEIDGAGADEFKREFLIPSFISALCAGLEGQINDGYIDFFFRKVGKSYRKYIHPFLSRGIRERFKILILLISDYKYEINEANPDIRTLFELFDLRNRLLHVKNHRHEVRYNGTKDYWYDFFFVSPDETDPYQHKVTAVINETELKRFMMVYNKLIPKLSNLEFCIRRKNFNGHDLFLKILN